MNSACSSGPASHSCYQANPTLWVYRDLHWVKSPYFPLPSIAEKIICTLWAGAHSSNVWAQNQIFKSNFKEYKRGSKLTNQSFCVLLRFTSTCMTKKRNSTRKKILTNSQDTNINATFTKTAFFINKENYWDWSVMFKNRSGLMPAYMWGVLNGRIVKEEKYLTWKIWSCWSLGLMCLKFHSNNNFVIIIKKIFIQSS